MTRSHISLDKKDSWLFAQAYDKISEVRSRLSFLYDAAPLKYTDESFTREGLDGMVFMISDMIDTLGDASDLLKKLATDAGGAA